MLHSVSRLAVASLACFYGAVGISSAAYAQDASQASEPAVESGVSAAPPVGQAPSAGDNSGGTTETSNKEIVVFGRGLSKIGVAHAASEGTISGSDLLVRPLLRVAELLEAVPGMVAAQHSGTGKANQYFLRGFNLDHGSDFTTYIDGVQMNFRTHGHGQGYLDLNGLIPEIIAQEDFRKGPYRADGGDFALAGAAYMTTISGYDRPWLSVEAGSYGHRRIAAGGTIRNLGGGDLTMVGEYRTYDGPWEQPEDLKHYAGFVKYAKPVGFGDLELTVHGYRGTWRPTEQIPERIIGSSYCKDVFCSPDSTAKGETTRIITNAKLSGDDWRANVYAQYYNWNMYSNPEYASADGSSAQIHQFDKRMVYGMTGQKSWHVTDMVDLTIGTENRYDDISKVGVAHTDAREFVESLGFYSVKEASLALFAEATVKPFEGLRLTGGLRGDYYHYSVNALDAEAAALGEGSGHDSLVSPKLSAAYKVFDELEVYASWGRGFHSNDVRGAVTTTPVPVLVKGTGKELGVRFQHKSLSLTATYWWLSVGSELRFVGDSNAVEPTEASTRRGYELVGFWRPFPWLALDASYTASHARYDNGDYIPNAFENAASAGISFVKGPWEASVRLRHLGPYPLIEDNSVRDKGSNVVNLRGARKIGRFQVYADLLNVLNSRDKDIAYYYTSYIPGFDSEPTDGRLSRVVEPRTLKVGVKVTF
ncbi:TonB-dependent receptor [Novosphingobium sp. Rr 2-17]|uniref:TonB-dependent receptor n=1 Tax=Novosphingobium sp. Rr 2-17 TaxID=555793 RepID=UPI000269A84A|nr:TonB-dependent receptor [Novosphingobium sp. Rr 2-17]EIZ78541.1 TonB-dependent receptor [Novosphingobium sp. Rr 2-17]